jgi:hypothetical protein
MKEPAQVYISPSKLGHDMNSTKTRPGLHTGKHSFDATCRELILTLTL